MIIWLASYPKSGNTWVRSFISSILFSKDGEASFDDLEKIKQYPSKKYFKNLVNNLQDINEVKKNWITSQDIINLDNKIKFLKTHHINCKIGNDEFTNKDNTYGAIYIVRDPRNVITSILHHYHKSSYQEAKEFIFDENRWLGLLKETNTKARDIDLPTLIGSWKTHYNSWKVVNKNFLLIKYEELLLNPENEFKKIVEYLKNLIQINIDGQRFNQAIEACSFKNLKKIEDKEGFIESVHDRESDNKKKFFNLGPSNDWKKLLDKDIRLEIEEKFGIEMRELDYL